MFSRRSMFGLSAVVGLGLGLAVAFAVAVLAQSGRSIEVEPGIYELFLMCSDDGELAIEPVTIREMVFTCAEPSDPAAHVPPPDVTHPYARVFVSPGEDAVVRCTSSARVLAYEVQGNSMFVECVHETARVTLPLIVSQRSDAPASMPIE